MPNSLVIPNEGKPNLLAYMIRDAISGINAWSLRLFVNDFTPGESSVLADFEEASFANYSPVTMTRSDWTAPVIVGNRAVSTWKTLPSTWLCAATGITVYGCYYTDDDLGLVRGAFRFDNPIAVVPGRTIEVLPAFTFETAPAPL